jgi:D-alanyl-D-alanine carboxypeptidase
MDCAAAGRDRDGAQAAVQARRQVVVLQYRLRPARPDHRGGDRGPLAAQLRKRLFAPLRLRSTSFDTKARIAGRHAHGYTRFGKGRLVDISVVSPTLFGAAGAIVSTADDLARFYRTLLQGRLLRPDLLQAMKTTVAVTPQQGYGLGLIRSRYGPCGVFWGHGGETFGYESFADSSSDGGRQAVIAINADSSVLGGAQEALGRLMQIAYCG